MSNNIRGSHVCKSCESIIIPKKESKGSFAVELIIWIACIALVGVTAGLSFILAIGYSIWRMTSKLTTCPVCGSQDIVPIGSPAAEKIIESLGLVEDK